jgi:hypothetical protein
VTETGSGAARELRTAPALTGSSQGVDWHLAIDHAPLLPGRLVNGRLALHARKAIEARALVLTLIAEEHWRHRVTRPGPNGTTRTEVVTSRNEVRRVPENIHGPLRLAAGEQWETTFDLPVPPMGPASLDARDAGLTWTLEGKLDIDDGFDSGIEGEIVVAQPTALLRAGSVRVGEFALYESAEVAADGVTSSIHLEPMPLIAGDAFIGRVTLELGDSVKLQEIRAEVRVEVEATVSGGESETIIAWTGVLAPGGSYAGTVALDVSGRLDPRPLPTTVLPHGQAQATFHVILARPMARDTHLERDVTIVTTSEL